MKGHTKIELTNVKTGEVQTFEDHNIVTNWLRDAHQIQLPWACDSFKHTKDITITGYSTEDTDSPRTPFTDFGGLLMFTEQLEADPDNYYPKGTVTMVGHASTDTYSGIDLTRGSFNDNLSSYSLEERRATLVWDFGMEQGNGTIGTVCLCNHVDGKIGYGSQYYPEDSNNAKAPFYHHAGYGFGATQFQLKYNVDPAETRGSGYVAGFIPVYVSKENNTATFMLNCLANDNFVFAVADIDATSVLPFDYIYRNSSTMYQYDIARRTQFVEVPVNAHHTSYGSDYKPMGSTNYFLPFYATMLLSGLDYQGNFWFAQDVYTYYGSNSSMSNSSSRIFYWTSGSAMKFTKVNLKTLETAEYSVYNTTGSTISINLGYDPKYSGHLSNLCVVNNHMYFRGDDAKLYAINLQNNSDVHVIKIDDGTDEPVTVYKHSYEGTTTVYQGTSYNYRRGWLVDVLGDKIIFNRNGGLYYYYRDSNGNISFSDDNMYILDTNTFTCKPLAAVQKPCCSPSPSTGSATNVPNNRNSGSMHLPCCTDSLVRFAFTLSTDSGMNTNYSTTWNTTEKYLTSNVSLSTYGYPPMGLLTINTLDERVTKTADMTMRITYTITA